MKHTLQISLFFILVFNTLLHSKNRNKTINLATENSIGVMQTSDCSGVQNLTVLNINTVSADVRWNSASTETEWEIIMQITSQPAPTSGTLTTLKTHRFVALSPITNYTVYVRTKCGDNDFSSWQTKNFTTGFDSLEMPVSFTPNSISTSGNFDIALVDLNGDFLDDVISLSSNNINVRYQLETGGYDNTNIITSNADYTPNGSLAAGDFDRNGYNDLIYAGESGVTFMQANETGTAYIETSMANSVFSQRSNFIDINNDGHLDAFVAHKEAQNVYYINDGSNNLNFYQGITPTILPNGLGTTPNGGNQAGVWVDFDNDRDLDLYMSKYNENDNTLANNELWRNDGNGVFVNVADSNGWYATNYPGVGHNNSSNLGGILQTSSAAWADYDNDGDMDVFAGARDILNSNSVLMINNGDGTFSDVTASSGVLAAQMGRENVPLDFDNDGYVDILTNGDILFNNGDLTFNHFSTNTPATGAIGDVNNDGFLDVFRSGNIYLNNTNTNNWIKVNTIGTISNRNGIGARVEIETTNGTQIRDVRSGEGFEFMSSLTTHFGIGTSTTVESISIYWPSGTIDYIANPAVNTTQNITEGSSPLNIKDETLVDLTIYPNPVENELTIKTSADVINKIATVFDINGKRVLDMKLKSTTIDVSSLTSGIYFLRLESEGKTMKQKFIKK